MDSLGKRIGVISVGPFGESVARYLRLLRPDMVELASVDLVPDQAQVIVLASGHPVPPLCDRVDKLVHKRGSVFIPVILESALLRVGPVVLAGQPPCWDCWARRCAQFAGSPNIRQALLQHYGTSNHGPRGHLASFAAIAAGRIAAVFAGMNSKQKVAGSLWQIDLLTRAITARRAEGIHDCPRCGMHRPAATRSFLEMQTDLSYLWEQSAGGGKKDTA